MGFVSYFFLVGVITWNSDFVHRIWVRHDTVNEIYLLYHKFISYMFYETTIMILCFMILSRIFLYDYYGGFH